MNSYDNQTYETVAYISRECSERSVLIKLAEFASELANAALRLTSSNTPGISGSQMPEAFVKTMCAYMAYNGNAGSVQMAWDSIYCRSFLDEWASNLGEAPCGEPRMAQNEQILVSISTAHLEPRTMDALQNGAYDIVSYGKLSDGGFVGAFVQVPPAEQMKSCDMPDDLRCVLSWAQELHYEWLNIDRDAEIIRILPTYKYD